VVRGRVIIIMVIIVVGAIEDVIPAIVVGVGGKTVVAHLRLRSVAGNDGGCTLCVCVCMYAYMYVGVTIYDVCMRV
jgi:hypothetical protein